MTNIKETDLYPHIKEWLEANGYVVHAEVGDCDVAARRGDELVLIEMKRAVNIDLLMQIVRRQEAARSVYAAVPAPKSPGKRWRELTRLLKRLEAGLLLVYLDSALPRVEIAFHPIIQQRNIQSRKTRTLLAEMAGRSMDLNCGGSNRRKLMTAYREQALLAAVCLEQLGGASPKAVRALGGPAKAGAILYSNHYGWFERTGKGGYALTSSGRSALDEYAALAAELRKRVGPSGETT